MAIRPMLPDERDYLESYKASLEEALRGFWLTLGLWGLPQQTVEALAFHHTPERLPRTTFDVLSAVYVADVLIDEQAVALNLAGAELSGPLDEAYLATLGVADQVPAWRALAAELIQTALEGS